MSRWRIWVSSTKREREFKVRRNPPGLHCPLGREAEVVRLG